MGAAVTLRDVVGETENGFLIRIVPLQSGLDDDAVLLVLKIDDGLV